MQKYRARSENPRDVQAISRSLQQNVERERAAIHTLRLMRFIQSVDTVRSFHNLCGKPLKRRIPLNYNGAAGHRGPPAPIKQPNGIILVACIQDAAAGATVGAAT
jgi:hypothetical protein